MRIAIYARVSLSNGRQELDNQLVPLRKWAERLGGLAITEFVDEASGGKHDRKALTQLLDAAHKRDFDILLVWALDRLSREGIARMTGYLEQFKNYGVKVMSHQESWLDTSGPVSDLLIAIFGWVAKQERLRIRERVLAGLERAKLKGKKLGRPSRFVDNRQLSALKEKGLTIRQMAQHLGIPKSTLSRALSQNPPLN